MRIVAREDAGAGLTLVHLEPSVDIHVHYTRPGQVLVVQGETAGREDAYFALASPLASATLALLVRDAGTVAHRLLTCELGTKFSVLVPSFAGFPHRAGELGPFGLVAVGSALGAVRGLYLAVEAEGRAHEATLFLGVRGVDHVPLRAELERIAFAGSRVVVCVSDEAPSPSLPFEVRGGLVQEGVLAAAKDGTLPRGTVLYVAGPPRMMDDFRAHEAELGMVVHTNA